MLHKQPDTSKVTLLMDRTLHDRCNRVVEDNIPIAELLQQYPWIVSQEQLLKEFRHITDWNLTDQLLEMLDLRVTFYWDEYVILLKLIS